MSTLPSAPRVIAAAHGFGRDIIFGLPVWAAFLLALEPDNVARSIASGHPLSWTEELVRIAGASLLGALATPLVVALVQRYPITSGQWWRNLSMQTLGNAAIALGLIVVSCLLAAVFEIGDARPVLVALPAQINANWLLLIFCLAALGVLVQAVRFAPARAAPSAPTTAALADAVTIKSRGRAVRVELASIDWIESQGNYVALHAGGECHLLREPLQRFEEKLGHGRFVRIHRRSLVAIDRVAEVQAADGKLSVRLKDGHVLSVSRSYRDALRSALEPGRAYHNGTKSA